MGYDFNMVNKQLTLPKSYKPYDRKTPECYHLSGGGMSMVYAAMHRANASKSSCFLFV